MTARPADVDHEAMAAHRRRLHNPADADSPACCVVCCACSVDDGDEDYREAALL